MMVYWPKMHVHEIKNEVVDDTEGSSCCDSDHDSLIDEESCKDSVHGSGGNAPLHIGSTSMAGFVQSTDIVSRADVFVSHFVPADRMT